MVNVIHGQEQVGAGRIALHDGCAVFDQIETVKFHRRHSLGAVVIPGLDAIATRACTNKRLYLATKEERARCSRLGWEAHSSLSVAVLTKPQVNWSPSFSSIKLLRF